MSNLISYLRSAGLCLFILIFAGSAQAEIRILKLEIFDNGSYSSDESGGFQIDTARRICSQDDADSDGTIEDDEKVLEPFYDTIVGVTVINDSSSTIQFKKSSFKIARANGESGSFTTKPLSLISTSEVKAGETVKLFAFLMRASDDIKILEGKRRNSQVVEGFRNVTALLEGRSARGQKISIKAKYTFSFSGYDRCT